MVATSLGSLHLLHPLLSAIHIPTLGLDGAVSPSLGGVDIVTDIILKHVLQYIRSGILRVWDQNIGSCNFREFELSC